jgi:hypothetical protein
MRKKVATVNVAAIAGDIGVGFIASDRWEVFHGRNTTRIVKQSRLWRGEKVGEKY